MTLIRRATPSDIPAILSMARDMAAESPRYCTMRFNEEKLNSLALSIIRLNSVPGGVIVADQGGALVGMLAFHVGAHFFADNSFASDLVMYIRPEHRRTTIFPRMVIEFERWADEYGVEEKMLGVSAEVDSERTVVVLERMGYRRCAVGTVKGN